MTRTEKWAAALSVATIIVIAAFFSESVIHVFERATLWAKPSAELANHYGARHFSSNNPSTYDIKLAEDFFNTALVLEPRNAEANHQMARISFLRGDFERALSLIDNAINYGNPTIPSSYYVKGLIEGFMGRYDDSAKNYAIYIEKDPTNWAATNDLAWVLLKAKRYEEVIAAIDKVLPYWKDNPWLLNSKATALYELGRFPEAFEAVRAADVSVKNLTEKEWLVAYPGNDPLIAREGLQAFQSAVAENMHSIALAAGIEVEDMR